MGDNLARELEMTQNTMSSSVEPQIEYPKEKVDPSIEKIPQDIPIQKGFTSLETMLISVIAIILFLLILLNIATNFELTAIDKEIQDISSQIEETKIENENLKQHSYELTRYDRIHEIAEKYGLELHEENIKNIKEIK